MKYTRGTNTENGWECSNMWGLTGTTQKAGTKTSAMASSVTVMGHWRLAQSSGK